MTRSRQENEQAKPAKEEQPRGPKTEEEALEKALEDSFPASDPPSPAIQGTTSVSTPCDEDKPKTRRGH